MKLLFATGNPGKVISPKKELAKYGIEVIPANLNIVEIQADRPEQVVVRKAIDAFQRIGENSRRPPVPVLANDAGFEITALNGFPGPYVSPVTKAIGLQGYVDLMHLQENRRSCFVDTWALVRENQAVGFEIKVFTRRIKGRLARSPSLHDHPQQKSPLWRLFIPEGYSVTLAEMSDGQLAEHRRDFTDVYRQIAAQLGLVPGSGPPASG